MRSANTVQIESHAAATLRYIRASMDGAASVAVPGSAGIAMGSVGLLATALSYVPSLHEHWFGIWLVAAVVAAGVGLPLITQPASLRGLTLSGTPVRKFALCLLPSLFGGVVMTGVHWSSGNLHAIPGTWLLLYGCALISASVATTRTIAIMGASFVVLGVLALLLGSEAQVLMLGAGFGGLHILFGLLIGRKTRDCEI
ncbi:MAG TPA: hypothetical protein VN676_09500 [Steroidobacteraceae bacterium]|jgi:hypothetical protein|nr:hypothetical protein [Steroidobacteraceae bacterium]